MAPANIRDVVLRLKRRRLVLTRRDPDDGRLILIDLISAGTSLVRERLPIEIEYGYDTGHRTARRNFRVDTLISIRFIAHLPSESSATARSQFGSASSWPPRSRTRGRSTATLPAWNPILPWVRPQR